MICEVVRLEKKGRIMLLVPAITEQEVRTLEEGLPDVFESEDERQRRLYSILQQQQRVVDDDENTDSVAFLQVKSTLLLRPTHERPGLVAFHLPQHHNQQQQQQEPNRRPTCLAMTC